MGGGRGCRGEVYGNGLTTSIKGEKKGKYSRLEDFHRGGLVLLIEKQSTIMPTDKTAE